MMLLVLSSDLQIKESWVTFCPWSPFSPFSPRGPGFPWDKRTNNNYNHTDAFRCVQCLGWTETPYSGWTPEPEETWAHTWDPAEPEAPGTSEEQTQAWAGEGQLSSSLWHTHTHTSGLIHHSHWRGSVSRCKRTTCGRSQQASSETQLVLQMISKVCRLNCEQR